MLNGFSEELPMYNIIIMPGAILPPTLTYIITVCCNNIIIMVVYDECSPTYGIQDKHLKAFPALVTVAVNDNLYTVNVSGVTLYTSCNYANIIIATKNINTVILQEYKS